MIISAVDFWARGFVDLVPVIPPGATIAPSSAIPIASLGKVPGRKNASGVWTGLPWQQYRATEADVQKWQSDGANTGLKADGFPGLDVDCTDESLSKIIVDFALAKLGPASQRTGRAPKRLLVYKTNVPFSRLRLWIKKDGVQHLVEVLGRGNQYLVAGTHPGTLKSYEWDHAPTLAELSEISSDRVALFFDELGAMLNMIYDVEVSREGDGHIVERAAANEQTSLRAPSIAALREAVSFIPNSYDSRDEWIKVGYAIRAAAGEDVDEGFNIFAEWSDRWTSGTNAPGVVRADWRRIKPPFSLGWHWLVELARGHGYNEGAFPPLVAAKPAPEDTAPEPVVRSDQWLANEVLDARKGELRYAPEAGRWFVWSGSVWQPDATMQAEDLINTEMMRLGELIVRQGATAAEKNAAAKDAKDINSGGRAAAVRRVLQSRRLISIGLESFDSDAWILNTPGGIVDLKTGVLGQSEQDALCSKTTSVAPGSGTPTRWLQFMDEVCSGDKELEAFMRRWSGYCLTGSVREQSFGFMLGEGGNGKGKFLQAITGILGDYAKTAALDSFTVASGDRHSTDLASLEGARLVISSESPAGKRFDEQRIKTLTGEDRITARLMHQNNRSYDPTFKVLISGNSLPVLHNVDRAMKRRLQVIPFLFTPKVVDGELGAKLKAEWPAILTWMIQGCLEWQQIGLAPPATVLEHTKAYFDEMDTAARFLEEETTAGGWT